MKSSNPAVAAPRVARRRVPPAGWLLPACGGIAVLFMISLFIGASDLSWRDLWQDDAGDAWSLLTVSRLPRTIALLLAGIALAVAGLLMQVMVQNRYVEPSTTGTVESAMLGILFVALVMPDISVVGRMLVAGSFAMGGTMLFLMILRRTPLRSPFLVPLVGIVLGGIVSAVTNFFAYRYDMLQSLNAWTTGDFSGVLRGRYELLWIGFALACAAYLAADRFTVMGMGQRFSTNLGLNHRALTLAGLVIVSAVSTVVVITAGNIPFLGLVVPNVISLIMGDNMHRSLPWIALMGGGLALLCDIVGRLINPPYEIPIGVTMGILGCILFLYLILRNRNGAA
ncbi:iron ABC transporter permease [Bordetella sp. J329]|uniref:ABC transporter permease n=2 Tax=Kerstersia gyiorum TaxID=206506 RepID=UPI000FDF7AFA|nr:iron chelate uptake ABC transporter family permease subunit [Kerstersia gyiorum]AZV94051.1 iron ABC transporter permease [Bordetella sp. J329]